MSSGYNQGQPGYNPQGPVYAQQEPVYGVPPQQQQQSENKDRGFCAGMYDPFFLFYQPLLTFPALPPSAAAACVIASKTAAMYV